MINVLMALGTRPEIIKLAPLYRELTARRGVRVDTFWSGQHVDLAEGLADFFGIRTTHSRPDLMGSGTLAEKFGRVAQDIALLAKEKRYDWIIVQGDTMTAAAAATAAFLSGVPVAHIEAGLRTGDLQSPWPEEANRRMISLCTRLHFPPTAAAKQNLLDEGFAEETLVVSGNTVVDALEYARRRVRFNYQPHSDEVRKLPTDQKLVLVTGHRRENFGPPLQRMVAALQELARDGDKSIVFPVHLNPAVREIVFASLDGFENIHLIEPLRYPDFIFLMERAWTVITDSGGIQEEAPSFHRPIVITRESTERPEVVTAGFGRLVGSDAGRLVAAVREFTRGVAPIFIDGPNPFGRGDASKTIAAHLVPTEAVASTPRRRPSTRQQQGASHLSASVRATMKSAISRATDEVEPML